jgi:hypothetical protein
MSVEPKANLVAEDPKSARPASADGAFGDDAAQVPAPVVDGRLLDDERPLRDLHLERGVVEVPRLTPPQPRGQRFVDTTVKPDEVSACAQRQPVQVNRGDDSTRIREIVRQPS